MLCECYCWLVLSVLGFYVARVLMFTMLGVLGSVFVAPTILFVGDLVFVCCKLAC